MIKEIIKAFADSNEALPYNINSIATLRTNRKPLYSKLYPHPMGVANLVNEQLLANGIIRPPKSPYNNPSWVVDKKGTDGNGLRKKRIDIDIRKLNQSTIDDK